MSDFNKFKLPSKSTQKPRPRRKTSSKSSFEVHHEEKSPLKPRDLSEFNVNTSQSTRIFDGIDPSTKTELNQGVDISQETKTFSFSPSKNAVSFATFIRNDPLQYNPTFATNNVEDKVASRNIDGTLIQQHKKHALSQEHASIKRQTIDESSTFSRPNLDDNTAKNSKHKELTTQDNHHSRPNTLANRYFFGSSKNNRPTESWISISDDPPVYPFLNRNISFGKKASTSNPIHTSDLHVNPASKYRFNLKQASEDESSQMVKEDIEDFVDSAQSRNWGEGCTSVAEAHDTTDNTIQHCSNLSVLTDVQAPKSPIYPEVSAQISANDLACTTVDRCVNGPDPLGENISIMELAHNPNFMNCTRTHNNSMLISPMQWLSGVKLPTITSNDLINYKEHSFSRQRKHMLRGGYEERLVNLIIREKSDHAMWAHGLRREDSYAPIIRHPSLYVEVYRVKETYGTTICRCRQLPFDADDDKTTHFDLPPVEDEFIDILLSLEYNLNPRFPASRNSVQPNHIIHVGDLLKIYKPYQEYIFDSASKFDDWEIPRKGLIVTRFVVSAERGINNSDVSDPFRDRDKPI